MANSSGGCVLVRCSVFLMLFVASLLTGVAAAGETLQGKLAIDVTVLGVDEKPVLQPSCVTVWMRTAAASEPGVSTVVDPVDGTVWRRVTGSVFGESGPTRNGKDRFLTHPELEPGVYRVSVFVGDRDDRMVGMAVSQPIELDGTLATTPVSLCVDQGPLVTFTVIDAQTRHPVAHPRPGIQLKRGDAFDVELNPLNPNLFPGADGKFVIEHLAPGAYRVNVSTKSYSYGYPDYESGETRTLTVREGEPQEFVLELNAKVIDEEEAKRRWPWAVEGTVSDAEGKPLEGVAIRAARGWGSLRSTLPVSSDQQGRYLLRFGPGMMTKNEKTGSWGAGVQAATVFAGKPGYAPRDFGRQGGLLMADAMLEEGAEWDREKIILPQKPYRLDFIMEKAVSLEGRLTDESGKALAEQRVTLTGDEIPPSSSVIGSAVTDADGRFRFNEIAPGVALWFELNDGSKLAISRTQSIRPTDGAVYQVALQIVSQENTGQMLRITSVRDSQGSDIFERIEKADPRALPFLDAESAQQAVTILTRMSEVNRRWFGVLPPDIKSLQYTFQLAGEEPRKITYQDYIDAQSWYREWYAKGISYTGAARVLASLRERAKYRQLQVGDDRIEMFFVLRDLPSTVAAGNGISGTWKGFFSTAMREGTLTLDARRYTPLSIDYGERREIYSDYVEIEPGQFVPRRIQILSPGMEFDFRFQALEPNLWLFDRSYRKSGNQQQDALAWITDISINGEAAVPRASK